MAQRAEGSVEVRASPSEVMAAIADFEAYPEWSDVESAEVLERDDRGRGTVVAFRVGTMGLSASYTLVYQYAEADRGVSWTTREAEGALRDVSGEYVLEETPGGTLVTYRLAVDLAVPLPRLLRRQGERRVVRAALEGLKRRVEEG